MSKLLFTLCLAACGSATIHSNSAVASSITPAIASSNIATMSASTLASASISQADASRFLTQTTFGVTDKDIEQVQTLGYQGWIDQQIEQPQLSHLIYVSNLLKRPEVASRVKHSGHQKELRMEAWWGISLTGKDQLRQRVAFALSQIFVVSDKVNRIAKSAKHLAYYYDVLGKNAFGNYRDLLEDVTLSPTMGIYLSMLGNAKANERTGKRPDENYAREIMQLFSIGLVELNQDGTPKLDKNGQPIPTYTQEDIENYARVFTGWNYPNTTKETWWRTTYNGGIRARMNAVQEFHDKGEKHLLGNVVVPAGQTAQEDLAQALDSLYNHPNVAPFIGKQLIQRLVTSNPSPEYVARVSAAFNDNGQGVRGDLGAVVKAILLDKEARQGHINNPDTFGKLREPLLQITHLWRTFNVTSPNYRIQYNNTDVTLNQSPLSAPSVFNFFSPQFLPEGEIKAANVVAPEFEILTENQSIRLNNFLYNLILRSKEHRSDAKDSENLLRLRKEMALLAKPKALIDRLNILLLSGQMPQHMYDVLIKEFDSYKFKRLSDFQKVTHLIFLIMNTPQYAIQK